MLRNSLKIYYLKKLIVQELMAAIEKSIKVFLKTDDLVFENSFTSRFIVCILDS